MNHDDIEGVFRDAAENYQVRTDKAFNWDKINRAVHKNTGNDPGKPRKKNKRRFVFWFFLLISLSLFSYSIWRIEFSEEYAAEVNKQPQVQNKTNTLSDKEKNAGNAAIQKNEQASVQKASPDEKVSLSEIKEPNKERATPAENISDNISNKQKATDKNNLQQTKIKTPGDDNATLEDKKGEIQIQSESKPNNNDVAANNSEKGNTINNVPPPVNKSNGDERSRNIASDSVTTDKTAQQTNTVSAKGKTNKNEGRFYAGVQVSPDITFIKFQKAQGVGAEFGLTAGYQLNKKWSIETGVLLNKKRYYTKGEYFDKSRVWLPNGADLVSVSGKCTMIEIPLNLRYNFALHKKYNLTLAAGASSYFMTREYYDYSLVSSGQTQTMEQTYHSSSKKILAAVNLSAGFERRINSSLTFRAEPYFKIPVSGIGTGKLYMSSTGINLGVIKYFGKK
jgi:hypothetical protein